MIDADYWEPDQCTDDDRSFMTTDEDESLPEEEEHTPAPKRHKVEKEADTTDSDFCEPAEFPVRNKEAIASRSCAGDPPVVARGHEATAPRPATVPSPSAVGHKAPPAPIHRPPTADSRPPPVVQDNDQILGRQPEEEPMNYEEEIKKSTGWSFGFWFLFCFYSLFFGGLAISPIDENVLSLPTFSFMSNLHLPTVEALFPANTDTFANWSIPTVAAQRYGASRGGCASLHSPANIVHRRYSAQSAVYIAMACTLHVQRRWLTAVSV